MEGWKTYTPDGRVLEVEYTDGEWIATCEGVRGTAASARAAISDALGTDERSIRSAEPALGSWIAEHAAQLEAEAS